MNLLAIAVIAATSVFAGAAQRSPQSPFEIDKLSAAVRRSEPAHSRAAAEEARLLEMRMQDVVRAWNSFAMEYVDRGTFNLRKAREVTKAWRKLQSEATWPKR
ncbi:MAG: hypothetical protein HYX25_06125 [Candidatus Solibacter usitatus]|nr:hypothetical protein [Candidatus Solibacter usitatus]